jgi:vancomycin permeability regulator SanA
MEAGGVADLVPMGRSISACIGLFALVSLRGGENLWWIDVRPLPSWTVGIAAAALLGHAITGARWLVAVPLVACVANVAAYYRAPLFDAPAVPFSALVVVLLAVAAWNPWNNRKAAAVTIAVLAVGLPLSQAWFFGKTDYRRDADAIVVLGARVYADGTPSDALKDRVRTGVDLFHAGHAPTLLMSGGPGEPEAMRDLAIKLGVPAAAIELDPDGLNTRATVANTRHAKVLAVSHHWHLPRVKMAYRQAEIDAYTVPARERYVIRQTPYLLAREVAAFWWYWARG